MVPQVEPKGDEFRSNLPRNVLEGGIVCMDYPVGVGNPLHYHKMTGEIHVPEPPRGSPLGNKFLRKCTNLPQIEDGKASLRIVYDLSMIR